jgi:hypothetical protein
MQAFCKLEDKIVGNVNDYMLKVNNFEIWLKKNIILNSFSTDNRCSRVFVTQNPTESIRIHTQQY